MRKRLTALLLVMGMALSLAGCGAKKAEDPDTAGKHYASDKAMDVFQAIEAIHSLKDFTYALEVSNVDQESGALAGTRYTVDGAWYTSTHQASFTVKLADESVLTTVVVDGTDLYADVGTAQKNLSEHGQSEYAKLSEDMVHFTLQEDPWTALESGRLSAANASLKELYEKVKHYNAKRVKKGKQVSKLSLGLGDLQGTLLDITGDLINNKAVYQQGLGAVLQEDFGMLLDSGDWTTEALLEQKWSVYEETYETLMELQTIGDFNGWTAKLLACGEEGVGYSLDLTKNFDQGTNYCLSVWPAQAEPVKMPQKAVEAQDAPGEVLELYLVAKHYLEQTAETKEEPEEMTQEELEENLDLSSGTPIEGRSREDGLALVDADITIDDGVSVTVPFLSRYDKLEGEGSDGSYNDIYQASNGYMLEYVTAEARDPKKAAKENAEMYVKEFRDTWGFEIVQEASEPQVSADGKVAMAGMGYRDKELGQDVTVITGCIGVEGSKTMLNFDLFVYSKSVTDKELQSIEDLMHALGVELPVTVTKN